MYRIGEFSLRNQVTIKTLRYYDQIGLFKPSVVDEITGYRYYSDNQQEQFNQIMKYKELGFSLEEIKKMNKKESNNVQIIKAKVDQLILELNDTKRKINILNDKLRGNIMRVEFRPYIEKYKIGKRITLENRDCENQLKKIKEEIEALNPNLILERPVICNLELGYTKENIDVFLGYELKENTKLPENIGSLEIMLISQAEKLLIGKGNKKELDTIYSDMVQYAHNENIQIRGFFTEAYTDNEVEIYVEAFDLNTKNEDYIYYLKNHKVIKEIKEELIGEYQIREILPDAKWMFNINKQKSILDTKFAKLKLNADGTTNFENITWNKKELVLNLNGVNIPLPIHEVNFNNEKYLEILMNENYNYYESQRPLCYLYKKL